MINRIIEKAKKEDKKVYIYTHKTPDGDAICSACAIAQYLNNNVIDATCVFTNRFFAFPQIINEIPTTQSVEDNSISIIVDTSTINYAENKLFLSSSKEDTYIIDHHLKNEAMPCIEEELNIPTENVIRDTKAISTTEILLNLFEPEQLSPEIANMLTLGIIKDSANLQFIKENTLSNLQKLLELGVNYEQLKFLSTPKVTLRESVGLAKLLLKCQKIDIGTTFGLILSLDNATVNDAFSKYGIRNIQKKIFKMLNIENCSFNCISAENMPGEFDLEFRNSSTYGNFNVHELAAKYNGGGHFNASGCHLSQKNGFSYSSIIPLILENISKLYSPKTIPEINLSDLDIELLQILNDTNKLTSNLSPNILTKVSDLLKQGANYDYAIKEFKAFDKFLLENEILSRIPESTFVQKNPIVSIYLSKHDVQELCEQYHVNENDISDTIKIFENINIGFASISFNGKKVQIARNGNIKFNNSDKQRNKQEIIR